MTFCYLVVISKYYVNVILYKQHVMVLYKKAKVTKKNYSCKFNNKWMGKNDAKFLKFLLEKYTELFKFFFF